MSRARVLVASVAASLAALCALPALAAATLTCKLPATPQGAKVEIVTPQMRSNGVLSTVRSVEAALPVDGMLAFYRNLWAPLATKVRPGSMEQSVDGWKVISTVEGACFTTVQVRAQGGGSYSLVSVMQKPDASSQRPSSMVNFPQLAGSKTLRDVDYADPVRNARTVVLMNAHSLQSNLAFYQQTLKDQGWVTLTEKQVDSTRGATYVLVLKRNFEEMNVVIAPSSQGAGVTVVANVTDRP